MTHWRNPQNNYLKITSFFWGKIRDKNLTRDSDNAGKDYYLNYIFSTKISYLVMKNYFYYMKQLDFYTEKIIQNDHI